MYSKQIQLTEQWAAWVPGGNKIRLTLYIFDAAGEFGLVRVENTYKAAHVVKKVSLLHKYIWTGSDQSLWTSSQAESLAERPSRFNLITFMWYAVMRLVLRSMSELKETIEQSMNLLYSLL